MQAGVATLYNFSAVFTGTHTNFPVLISGKYPFLASAANGGRLVHPSGFDLIFTTDA